MRTQEISDNSHIDAHSEREPQLSSSPSYVVGIGASAGGLEALERFFETMPDHTGMAFVVVQHLSPDFKSVMDELLARKTRLPIFRVEEGQEVRADAVYLIPPKKDMIIANGRLLLTDKDPKQLVTLPIDHFFRSLAHDCGERAIGVILSGTGSDGSRGLRDIHDAGGLVIAQTPETAKFDGMPNSARQTGVCDLILPPEEMPAALLQYIEHPLWQELKAGHDLEVQAESGLEGVFRLLRDAYGIDFSHYKSSTVTRRIDRRRLLNRSFDVDEYLKRLASDPEELNALYKDLLIGVTRFFRDLEAFQLLATEVLPRMIAELDRDEDLRLWVAGCATGEEAYSLAIAVREALDSQSRPVNVKIFATDVHRASLDFASAGVYQESQLSDMTPQRLARFFERKGDGFHIARELREMVVFAPHNVIKDAPFTKLDLITCRNLLIYLQPQAQKKVLSLFHFALKTGAVLFLGPSESPGELNDEFALLDARWKLYRKRRDIRLPADLRLPLSSSSPLHDPSSRLPPRAPLPFTDQQQLVETYDILLDKFMPPSLLVNERRELVETFAGASRYLRLKDRRVSMDILELVEGELRVVLSGALQRVFADRASVAYKGLRLACGDEERLVNVTLQPIVHKRSNAVAALIGLEDQGEAPAAPPAPDKFEMGEATREHLGALEAELRYTRENLQATIEELETSNEELQATNEELVASNEELQSTNEELHSVNEELYTVNSEYQKKISELTELTADMDNLLESTQVHTLFLDRNLCIRKFTPMIAETFHLIPQDVGRRIDSFTHNIDLATLNDDIRAVMETGTPSEKQVRDRRGQWFLLRILPYHSKQAVAGVVLTMIDLAHVKRAEAETRAKDRQLSTILKNSPHLLHIKDAAGRFLMTSRSFDEVAGGEGAGKTVHDLFPKETAQALALLDERVLREGNSVEAELVLTQRQPPSTFLTVIFPLRDDASQIVGLGGIGTDVTRLKQAEQQARDAVAQRDCFLAMLSHELRNPLGAIVNATLVFARPDASEDAHREAMAVIQRQSSQMDRLLDDLLEVSRFTQNKIHIHPEPVLMSDIVDEAVRVVQPTMDQGQLTVEVSKEPEPLVVSGDPARLQQVLINLLMNSAKYTPPQGRVQVDLRRRDGWAVVHVKDSGAGIRADLLHKVFEPFVQADETLDRAKGGIGVGLTLVRSIVELHGGAVTAHSDGPGTGSAFTVLLPLAHDGARADLTTAPPLPASISSRIAIVEDNEDSGLMLKALLTMSGHEVAMARTGNDGLSMILAEKPALALIDIGLPGIDGYELARQIRAQLGADPFLVALTGYGRPTDRQKALEAGFNEHIVKPVRGNELERIIKLGLKQSQATPWVLPESVAT